MKLLIITQKVDKEDPILGFFHRWVEKFAEKLDEVFVICLWQGKYNLPQNVSVFSLGKERGISKIGQLFRLQKYLIQILPKVDGVFIHMCPIYAVASFPLVKIYRKKMILWYIHKSVNWKLKLAGKWVDKILTASPESCQLKNRKKIEVVGHGIDTDLFKRDNNIQKIPNSILFLGRVSPIKGVDILIEAATLLDKGGVNFILNIIGEPGEKDKEYFDKIKDLSKELESKGKIKFLGRIPNYLTSREYNQNEIFVNLTPPGLFDKTILEAIACQTLTLVSSQIFQTILPNSLVFKEKDPEDLKNKIIGIFKMKAEEKVKLSGKLRNFVIQNYNLDNLINKIIKFYE